MPNAPKTKQTPIRLTDEDKALIDEVKAHARCNTMADAIRYSLRLTSLLIMGKIQIQEIPKKSRKGT